PFVRPEGHYIRHVGRCNPFMLWISFKIAIIIINSCKLKELTEKDLVEIVEYDMDEQDNLWLKAFNQERKKEDLGELTADVFEAMIDRLEKEWFDLVINNYELNGPLITCYFIIVRNVSIGPLLALHDEDVSM
ncbi:17663_t:CDS:2, partial [Gigaspora rosea]